MTSPARTALDAHTELYESMKHPADSLVRFFDDLVTRGREIAHQRNAGRDVTPDAGLDITDEDVLAAWDYYVWPARTGRELLDLTTGPLFSAPTYQVTGEIVGAVTGMYRATAAAESALRHSDPPSRTGFAYLDEPVSLGAYNGEVITTRALSWAPQLFNPDGGRSVQQGVRVTSWGADTAAGGPFSMIHSVFVPFGAEMGQTTRTPLSLDDITRWLHCLWLFMDTEIVITTPGNIERASRRRAQRSGKAHADVTVILLRYRHYEGEGGSRNVDWSCRWVVQGHHRHLGDYAVLGIGPHHAKPPGPGQRCEICEIRTTRIGAYVKGPEGKSLKPTAKVFRVSR